MKITNGPKFLFMHFSKVPSKQSMTTWWGRNSFDLLIFWGLIISDNSRNAEFVIFVGQSLARLETF